MELVPGMYLCAKGLYLLTHLGWISIVSYFRDRKAPLFALTIVRISRLGYPDQCRVTIVITKQGSWVSLTFTSK